MVCWKMYNFLGHLYFTKAVYMTCCWRRCAFCMARLPPPSSRRWGTRRLLHRSSRDTNRPALQLEDACLLPTPSIHPSVRPFAHLPRWSLRISSARGQALAEEASVISWLQFLRFAWTFSRLHWPIQQWPTTEWNILVSVKQNSNWKFSSHFYLLTILNLVNSCFNCHILIHLNLYSN